MKNKDHPNSAPVDDLQMKEVDQFINKIGQNKGGNASSNGRFIGLSFDFFVMRWYANKVKSCMATNKEFNLTISEVRKLLSRKVCPYSGIRMTHFGAGVEKFPNGGRPSDISLDRIDNSKGYIRGNVIAVSSAANHFKGIFENPQFELTMEQGYKTLDYLLKQKRKKNANNT